MRALLAILLTSVVQLATMTDAAQSTVSPAQVADTWQGTLHARNLRYVLRIVRTKRGVLSATFFSIDRASDGFPVDAITLSGTNLKFSVSQVNGAYEGTMSPDGKSISGVWTQGAASPLEFQRATKSTRWPTDVSPHKVRLVKVADNVTLEVLDWGGSGPPLVLLSGEGDTAHVFDRFALNFTFHHHVYGITRRGLHDFS
jgi:non-heme chloroperoxidase